MFFSYIRLIGLISFSLLSTNFVEATNSTKKLGTVSFPTSAKEEAQRHFQHGIAALHSFWYPEALAAFKRSTKSDPSFAMGYWGEAMAHNHPLWEEQDIEAAKIALSHIPDNAKITKREKYYIDAIQILYQKGNKFKRDKAYSKAMEKIYLNYPNDLEAACFYSLSLLGLARNTENKLPLQIKSGAIALEVSQKNPNHPCAAHYAIHAFDTPELARLALLSAKRFSKIASASAHAQHMPAHIFIQLGMWKEATNSNKNGWETSLEWVEKNKLAKSKRDYHSLQWLHYTYLQQGLLQNAAEVFNTQQKDMRNGILSNSNKRASKYYPRMLSATIIETEEWQKAAKVNSPEGWNPKSYSLAEYSFVLGFAHAMQGKFEKANKYLSNIKTIRRNGFHENHFKRPETLQVWELEIQVAIKLHQEDYNAAIQMAKQATLIEANLPSPSGPPRILKPTYELLGEVYLKANKPVHAQEQFSISLIRHPKRLRSLLGAARAAKINGEESTAKEIYTQLSDQLKNSDPEFPELIEAKKYLDELK